MSLIPESKLPIDKDVEFLIKAESHTDPNYGTFPEDRPINDYIKNGIINLDKPSGPTSHEVASWVRKILKVNKTGHAGTLDPRVTGVLPVAIENSCKVLQTLLKTGKEYICIMHLHEEVPEDTIRKTLNEFVGKIYQRPPLRSSVKQRLRIREIYYIEILEINGRDVLFFVGCEAGTYIRKLVHDLGLVFGTGAHMRELRRTRVGPFSENENLNNLHDIVDAYHFLIEDHEEKYLRKIIMPLEFAASGLPKIYIRDSAIDAICHGAKLTAPGVLKVSANVKSNSLVGIFSLKNELVALLKSYHSAIKIKSIEHGLVGEVKRVIMEPNTYPSWDSYK
ncbi:MAG: RNA-guided pseudouridylation complex pseudouridine synthase subunit Cbf5 [Candidatus Lokiarchaeota archaeon]|nr:RNA-guided pseudouridylation complex pseudouridine synthase subunit Cbf5 [Candidatus Lokiarchaeota archaeon]